MRLLEAIAARAGVANKLAADRRRIDANLPRDVGLRVAALQERVNLAALFAGQMEIAFGHFSSVRCAVPRKDSLPSDRQKNRHTQHGKVWREKTSASRVLAALASSPATKALDPDPFPRHSLRHAVYAALLHFGFETAIIKIIKKCLYLARKRLSATNRRQPSDKPATTQRQYREVATQTWLKLLHGLAPRRWRQHPWLRALLRLLLRCPHGQLHVFAVQLRPAA